MGNGLRSCSISIRARKRRLIAAGQIVASTHMDRAGDAVESRVSLRAFEGVVIRND